MGLSKYGYKYPNWPYIKGFGVEGLRRAPVQGSGLTVLGWCFRVWDSGLRTWRVLERFGA